MSLIDFNRAHPVDAATFTTQGGIAFAYSFVLLAYIQFAGPEIVGTDGYYHIKVADLIRQYGVPLEFPWLQYTILDQQGYTDHHLLLHAFQALFTAFLDDLPAAAKWSAVVTAALAFAVIALVLLRCGVKVPLLWVFFLFAASSPFLYRMSMARGQSLSLALQVLAFYFMLRRRYTALAVLCVVFVWAYNAFPILLPLAAIGMVVHYVVDRRIEYKLLIAVAAGLIVGLVSHPYFPQDVLFLWNHIVPKLFATDYATRVGREWYPYNSWQFLTFSLGAVVAYLVAIFLSDWRSLTQDKARLFWFLTAAMYFLLFLKSRRFAEYFPPSAIILLALTTRDWPFWERPKEYLRDRVFLAASVVVAAFVTGCFLWTMNDVRDDIRRQSPADTYRGAARWLEQNTPAGSLLFHTDWDDFPKLFHFNTHNRYIIGLDPDFMRVKNPALYHQWKNVTQGKVDEPEPIISGFGAEYVFTDLKHKKFIRKVEQRPRFELVYSDQWSKVYRLHPEPTEKTRGQAGNARG